MEKKKHITKSHEIANIWFSHNFMLQKLDEMVENSQEKKRMNLLTYGRPVCRYELQIEW